MNEGKCLEGTKQKKDTTTSTKDMGMFSHNLKQK